MDKRGQVWVETVIYTLIGLSLIGLVLAIVTPKINELNDRSIIENTIDSIAVFDSKIREVLAAPGNVRVIEFKIKRGDLYLNASFDEVRYTIEDSRSLYSEDNITIKIGRINVLTKEGAKRHTVSLWLNYTHNLTFEGVDDFNKFSSASVPYRFSIENKGFQSAGQVWVDVKETS